MKKIHFSITTQNIAESIADYSKRLEQSPCVVIDGEYALWRTATVNFSIRYDESLAPGQLRHLGWEDEDVTNFSSNVDVNGIVWERFSEKNQRDEIKSQWPSANF